MWYISFHGGSKGINNIRVYHDNGDPHAQPDLLPTGGFPALQELRGFVIAGNLLYVVNAYKKYSQILVYEADGKAGYHFKEVFADGTINSILHPYDLTFDPQGHCYVSNQDTNVVTGLQAADNPLPVASYLQQHYSPSDNFLKGTIVASSKGALPGTPTAHPPDVSTPQGLEVGFTPNLKKVNHSVRGVLFHNGYLYVADEPADAVKVYEVSTGKLYGQIAGDKLKRPVQLLLEANTTVLYISSSGNHSVMSYDLSQGPPSEIVAPRMFINGEVKNISGMAFDADGCFYAAERIAKKIKKFPPDGRGSGEEFIKNLPDEPEFILYVPKKA
jgi:hypothetical protein